MTVAINTFEGGTNTTAISTGNSGGTSGTAFDSALNALFSNTRAAHGLLSARLPASTSASMGMNLSGSGSPRWMRAYLWSTSWSSSPVVMYLNMGTPSFGHFRVELTATQARITHNNGSTDSTIATISVTPATSAWIRVEMQALNDTTGACELKLFNTPDSDTPSGTATGARTQTAAPWTEALWINQGSADVYADDVGWSDISYLGSAVPSLRPRPIISSFVAVHHAANW